MQILRGRTLLLAIEGPLGTKNRVINSERPFVIILVTFLLKGTTLSLSGTTRYLFCGVFLYSCWDYKTLLRPLQKKLAIYQRPVGGGFGWTAFYNPPCVSHILVNPLSQSLGG